MFHLTQNNIATPFKGKAINGNVLLILIPNLNEPMNFKSTYISNPMSLKLTDISIHYYFIIPNTIRMALHWQCCSLMIGQDFRAVIRELRAAISVLFTFQRRPLRDEVFVNDTRGWLSRLVGVLLRVATWQDHLFLIHHVLR